MEQALKKIDIRYKTTFLSSIIFGILSQGMGLFNKYSFHDDVAALFAVGHTYTSGRWMLGKLDEWVVTLFGDGHYSLPIINGGFSLLCIAFAAVLIVYLLDVRKKHLCAFVGGIMAVFPVITSLFAYMFTAPYYMLGMLAGVGGTVLICKCKKWYCYIAGIIIIGASIGVYQAYIPMNICLMLFYLIKTTYGQEQDKILDIIKRTVKLGIGIVGALAVYLGMNQYFLHTRKLELTSYMGISSVGSTSLAEYAKRVLFAYKEFLNPTESATYYMYPSRLIYVYYLVVGVAIILLIFLLYKTYRKNWVKGIVLTVFSLCIPLAVNFIFVMASPKDVHSLMIYSGVMTFVIFVWILDVIEISQVIVKKVETVLVCGVLLVTLIMYSRFDNKCYMQATFAHTQAISYFTTLTTQIKSVDGYSDDLSVAFINAGQNTDLTILEFNEFNDINLVGYEGARGYMNDYMYWAFMKNWCGFSPVMTDASVFENNEEVKEMPHYPDSGSIRIIDGVVVVKF